MTSPVLLSRFSVLRVIASGFALLLGTGGVIDYRGDWCSTTDGPATAACADAMHVTADFAASAVPIDG